MDFNWKDTYARAHDSYPGFSKRPLIGLTGNFSDGCCTLTEAYYTSVLQAGATPVILPPLSDRDAIISVLDRIDGIVFTGGADINPLYMDEEPRKELHGINPKRDIHELLLCRLAYDRQIPMLGICRGIQLIAAALGGSVYQDIYSQAESRLGQGSFIKHSQDCPRGIPTHTVTIEKGSLLESVLSSSIRDSRLAVNSFHHQAVKEAGDRLRVSATSPDGIIEAVESSEMKPILAVQWHPENFYQEGDDCMRPLFAWIVRESAMFARVREIHSRNITFDSHCDTPMFFPQGIRLDERDDRLCVDLHKMREGMLDASLMVAYIPQGRRDDASLGKATEMASSILTELETMVRDNSRHVAIAVSPDDIPLNKRLGKKSIFLGIENGYAIAKDLSLIEKFRRRGVTYITLCHNGHNDICDSARPKDYDCPSEHNGLSGFGREVIREMNRTGMMVDLSHASEKSFYDAIETSSLPIVCSHSSSRALCDHPRNLTDDQMRALSESGGVAQLTLYSGFLRKDGEATIEDAIRHLDHMVDVMGIDHVGIGTDFDGDGGIRGCMKANEIPCLTRHMLMAGYTEDEIRLIWGGNFLKLMRRIQKSSEISINEIRKDK